MDDVSTIEAAPPARGASLPLQARLWPFALVTVLVAVADQLTKFAVRGWLAEGEVWPSRDALLRLAHVENSGAAFGILQGAGGLLIVTTVVGAAAIVLYLLFATHAGRLHVAGLGLVLGGAVGNFIDRVFRGTVTDFIDPTHYPAFNLADSAIVIGVIGLIALSFLDPGGGRERAEGDR